MSGARSATERSARAVACYAEGCNCAQAVLSAFAAECDLSHPLALRLATPFGGGMARTGGPCGALAGACMVVGLTHGQATPGDRQAKEETYRIARQVIEEFRKRNGAVNCPDLLGCDLGTPEGMARAHAENLFVARCHKFIRDAVEIVDAARHAAPHDTATPGR